MFLRLRNITKRFGSVTALRGVSLEVEEGEFVCFLGPSGCGKTTLLRVVAGLETPDEGEIRLGDRNLSEVPARLRNFGVVFQSYSLFPNMTVAKNIAYGLECRGWRRDAMQERVAGLLALIHLEDQAHKLPHQLSGGQQQRVALARALAAEPAMLLLDEPLSALDAKVREDLRGEIRDLQSKLGITTIMVTHDQDEAMEMADRIVVMNEGVIDQTGSAAELYERPASRFVAEFIGRMNVLRMAPGGGIGAVCGGPGAPGAPGARRFIGIRPEHVELVGAGGAGDDGDGAGIAVGTVEKVVYLGSITRITLALDDQKLLVELRGKPDGLAHGARLTVRIPADSIHEFEESAP
ncbi:MAG TPA: ATP-binding cassette domain-containing protein [Thermohalobaculum sp.]|nr:ATP-binding cassette domain-containing protein [Thermohalobaculum sp.]